MEKKSALVFRATGLVGNLLVNELIENNAYSSVQIFVRKKIESVHPKVSVHIIDFKKIAEYKSLYTGTDLFICLGTTIKKAGSVENMEQIDKVLPVAIASLAVSNGVKNLAVVSTIGANKNSRNYYLRIKGKMEEEMLGLGFEKICIARPSLLLGQRKEKRIMESFSKGMMNIFGHLLLGNMRKYRPIHGRTVARAMIEILEGDLGKQIIESDKLQLLGK